MNLRVVCYSWQLQLRWILHLQEQSHRIIESQGWKEPTRSSSLTIPPIIIAIANH